MQGFDLIVVGAGPSGSAAAYHAANAGLRVLIVDMASFPRSKTCGDAILPQTVHEIERMGLTDLPGHRVRRIIARHRDLESTRRLSFHGAAGRYGLVISRKVLDQLLLDQALSAGARFETGKVLSVRSCERDAGCNVEIETKHGTVTRRSGYVVIATGTKSPRLLRPEHGPRPARAPLFAVAGRTYLEVPAGLSDELEVVLPVRTNGGHLGGYSWAFPIGPSSFNVGSGAIALAGRHTNVRRLVEDFIAWLVHTDPRFVRARLSAGIEIASIPISRREWKSPRVLIAGDAAGVPNPFSAEGIRAALVTGRLAAQAVATSQGAVEDAYNELVDTHIPRSSRFLDGPDEFYGNPEFMFGRGVDLFVAPHRTVGDALWACVLDDRPGTEVPAESHVSVLDLAVREVREGILVWVGKMSRVLGEVLGEIIADKRLLFGLVTGLIVLANQQQHRSAEVRVTTMKAATVLELLRLVRVLHDDLVASEPVESWGRNALSLALADSMNARALALLYELPSRWIRQISPLAARFLSPYDCSAQEGMRAGVARYEEFFTLATTLGAFGTETDTHVGYPEALARYLARRSVEADGVDLHRLYEEALRATAQAEAESQDAAIALLRLALPEVVYLQPSIDGEAPMDTSS